MSGRDGTEVGQREVGRIDRLSADGWPGRLGAGDDTPYMLEVEGSRLGLIAVSDNSWIQKSTDRDSPNQPVCSECRYDLQIIDKRYVVDNWAYWAECPCCRRAVVFWKGDRRGNEESVESIQSEFVSSDLMSTASLERSIRNAIRHE